MEQEEKRFVYRIRCSSDENNKEEEIEEGISVPESRNVVDSDSKNPFRFFNGSAIWRDYLKFQSVQMREKKDEVWALWGVIWTRNEWDMAEGRIGNEGFRKSEKLQISDFEFLIYRGRDTL